jgi:hypothetical protein
VCNAILVVGDISDVGSRKAKYAHVPSLIKDGSFNDPEIIFGILWGNLIRPILLLTTMIILLCSMFYHRMQYLCKLSSKAQCIIGIKVKVLFYLQVLVKVLQGSLVSLS